MKKILLSLAFGLAFSAANAAGLSLINVTGSHATAGFNGIAGFSGEQTGSFAALSASGPGTVKYTYLGSEAGDTNMFDGDAFGFLLNKNYFAMPHSVVGSSFTATVTAPGLLDFGFLTLLPAQQVASVVNGGVYNFNGIPSFMIASGASTHVPHGYDYFLFFNDRGGDKDFDDMVVGVNFTAAVPEPETYAMLLAGLGLMGAVARRRRNAI